MNTRPRVGTKAREHPRNALAPCPSCKNIQFELNGWGWLECLPTKREKVGEVVKNGRSKIACLLWHLHSVGRPAGHGFKKHPLPTTHSLRECNNIQKACSTQKKIGVREKIFKSPLETKKKQELQKNSIQKAHKKQKKTGNTEKSYSKIPLETVDFLEK